MIACSPFTTTTVDILPSTNSSTAVAIARISFTPHHALVLLHRCANFNQLKQIHAKLFRSSLHQHQIIAAKLIRLCSSYGQVNHATLIFHQIQNPTTFVWNLLIRAHAANASSRRAILLFNLMVFHGVSGDKFTFPFVMKACFDCCYVDKAREVYGFAVKTGFHRDVYLDNVLMDLYFKCGLVENGLKVFDKMPVKNVVSWTTALAGLINNGLMDLGRKLFNEMPVRNVMSWTAMINGYAKSDTPNKAFEMFSRMLDDGARPNEYTLVALVTACAQSGSLRLGRRVHEFAIKNRFDIGVFLGTALVDMYSKCNSLEDAKRVFHDMEVKSVATWNAMITSLGVHGHGKEAIELFEEMERMNVKPDAATLTGVLCACLQIDEINKGRGYFYYMTRRYGIKPSSEHYLCLFTMYSHVAKLLDSKLSEHVTDPVR